VRPHAVVAAIAAVAAPAAAETWRGQVEAGVEYDSNVGRVEDEVGADAAPMMRVRTAVDVRGGKARKARWVILAGGGARAAVAGPIDGEDAMTGSLDATVLRRTSDTLALSARATHYEVFPVAGDDQAHAFASSGADLAAALSDERGRTATVSVGARRLVYKPDPDFDWTGVTLAVAVSQALWRGADDASVDLAAGYRVEQRSYRGLGFVDGFVPGDRPRADLVQVASARAAYAGKRAASLSYEVTIDDSTSFGSSYLRQRLTAAVTTPLPSRVFATATITGQLDHYPEPQLVARDVMHQTFTALDDDARSGASVRLARGFGGGWQAEVRWAYHLSNPGDEVAAYHRQLIYAGVTWER